MADFTELDDVLKEMRCGGDRSVVGSLEHWADRLNASLPSVRGLGLESDDVLTALDAVSLARREAERYGADTLLDADTRAHFVRRAEQLSRVYAALERELQRCL